MVVVLTIKELRYVVVGLFDNLVGPLTFMTLISSVALLTLIGPSREKRLCLSPKSYNLQAKTFPLNPLSQIDDIIILL